MGLAAYGELDHDIYAMLRPILRVERGRVRHGAGHVQLMKKLLGMRRPAEVDALSAANLAYTGQRIFSELYFEVIGAAADAGVSRNLVLTGGCALNSSANGLVRAKCGFDNVFVPSAPGDDGNSIGAAYLAYYTDHPGHWSPRSAPCAPYLGSIIEEGQVARLRQFSSVPSESFDEESLCEKVATMIAQGQIVGWAQGRAEFGPRALGNRSILADPRREDMKERINASVKFREEFRPLAPAIIHEHGAKYFDDFQSSPYMERTLRFTSLGRERVPGVVHVDGTGRLQTVTATSNPLFHRLLQAFERKTGVPVLLNTSFNVMGKPIIHTAQDAMTVLMSSGLDAVVLGDTIFANLRTTVSRRGLCSLRVVIRREVELWAGVLRASVATSVKCEMRSIASTQCW